MDKWWEPWKTVGCEDREGDSLEKVVGGDEDSVYEEVFEEYSGLGVYFGQLFQVFEKHNGGQDQNYHVEQTYRHFDKKWNLRDLEPTNP